MAGKTKGEIKDKPLVKRAEDGSYWILEAYVVNRYGHEEPSREFDITDQIEEIVRERTNGHI